LKSPGRLRLKEKQNSGFSSLVTDDDQDFYCGSAPKHDLITNYVAPLNLDKVKGENIERFFFNP
jgi:hypothetical protein